MLLAHNGPAKKYGSIICKNIMGCICCLDRIQGKVEEPADGEARVN